MRTKKQQAKTLMIQCPFCQSLLDVHFDIKARPYSRCWRCEIRSFATQTTLSNLSPSIWIIKKENFK